MSMRAALLDAIDFKARENKSCGRFKEALQARRTLEKAYERYGADITTQVTNLNWIAYLAMQLDFLPEAERAARKCVEFYEPLATPYDEKLATYYSMLAAVLAESLLFSEAIKVYERAIAIFENKLGKDSDYVKDRKRVLQDMRNGEIRHYIKRRPKA
ncbi:MAG: tetratricopeptide repeat protein [Planctomycetaceae bacterium]|nr:tetratricopeptide repeat protein [Planctomycetaceae bacterium]